MRLVGKSYLRAQTHSLTACLRQGCILALYFSVPEVYDYVAFRSTMMAFYLQTKEITNLMFVTNHLVVALFEMQSYLLGEEIYFANYSMKSNWILKGFWVESNTRVSFPQRNRSA